MKFDKIAVGMVLYDVHSQKMGNTTLKTLGTWSVTVLEVDTERRRARVSWNSNPATWYGESQLAKLKAERPILIRTASGAYRRPTREELAEIRAKTRRAHE